MFSISVIMPSHASVEQYRHEAMESIYAQSIVPAGLEILWEVDTEEVGPAAMRNRLAERAKHEWLLLLDADDRIEPEFLHRAYEAINDTMLNPPTHIVVPSATVLTGAIYRDNYLPYCALISKYVWHRLGGHQEPSAHGRGLCDWDFWIRCHTHWPRVSIAYISADLFWHRERADSMSHSWTQEQFEKMREDLWQKHGIQQGAIS